VKAAITKRIAWVDRVGIGSEQGGYNTSVGSAVDCDQLALKKKDTISILIMLILSLI
jgi:hypothetical protein